MLVKDLSLQDRFKDLLLEEGITQLYPPQEDTVEAGSLESKNIILATPTASGKTLSAELAIIKALESGGKAVYVVPLKALAYEKYVEFRKYEKLGFSVRLEVGDLDSSRYRHTLEFDILVATAEKCDSILRSRPEWFNGVRVLVLDEIHLIATDRGPVYEILASKFRKLYPEVQVLGLSATIGNARELADWLDAGLVESDWRPVELREYVAVGKTLKTMNSLVKESVDGGGQVLVFVNSRRSAEALSEQLRGFGESNELVELSSKVLDAISSPTTQCMKLFSAVKKGVAFHHAGLVAKQRTLVEDAFKEGLIKVIVATPTLAAGVNLPSRMVIVRDLKRYTSIGFKYIPVLEYKQQVGRAGRPKYDSQGVAVSLAKTESEREFIEENYVNGEVEPIHSRLGVEPVLRFHVLASVASGFTKKHESLIEFFRSTFFGFQYGIETEFKELMDKIIKQLVDWSFVEYKKEFLLATPLGSRVSELYIDPQTAYNYLNLLAKAEERGGVTPIALLEVLSDSIELRPLLNVKKSEEARVWEDAFSIEDQLLRDLTGFDLDWEFLNRFKTARMFEDWITEKTEQEILDDYNVAPGMLNQKRQVMEWLVYSASELARIHGLKKSFSQLKKLETRVKYGVDEELLPLVSVKGVGRARARKLYRAGIKTVKEVMDTPEKKLADLLGVKIAARIRQELLEP